MAGSDERPTNVFDVWRRREAAAAESMPSWQLRARKSMSPPRAASPHGRRPVIAIPTARPTDEDVDDVKPVESRANTLATTSTSDHAYSVGRRRTSVNSDSQAASSRGRRPLRPSPPIQFTQEGQKLSSSKRDVSVVSPTARDEPATVRRGSRGRSNTWSCRRALHMTWSSRAASQDSGYNTRRNTSRERSPTSPSVGPFQLFFGDGLFDLLEESNEEITAFKRSITELRQSYPYFDMRTNPRFFTNLSVRHSVQDSKLFCRSISLPGTTDAIEQVDIKLHTLFGGKPLTITSNVRARGVDVIQQAIASQTSLQHLLPKDGSDQDSSTYILKVCGRAEYLDCDLSLESMQYVKDCIRYNSTLELVILRHEQIPNYGARTSEDDNADVKESSFQKHLEQPIATAVSQRGLAILIEAFQRECRKLVEVSSQSQPHQVVQMVKAIWSTLSSIEMSCVTEAISFLRKATFSSSGLNKHVKSEDDAEEKNRVELAISKLTSAVHTFVDVYCNSFDTNFNLSQAVSRVPGKISLRQSLCDVKGRFRVMIGSASRIPFSFQSYDYFQVECGLYYGGALVTYCQITWPIQMSFGFSNRLAWDEWIEFDIAVSDLPRETRLCCSLIGYRKVSGSDMRAPLGWVACCLFNFKGLILSGHFLFGLWPDEEANPIGTCASNIMDKSSVVLHIHFDTFDQSEVTFPEVSKHSLPHPVSQPMIDSAKKHALKMIITKDLYTSCSLSTAEKELLWNSRHSASLFLQSHSRSLPLILSSAPSWSSSHVGEVHCLVQSWCLKHFTDALELLHPRFPDAVVRKTAVHWIDQLSDEELSDFLPQLVQALKFESYHNSPLARLLVRRSLTSGRVAHQLFWLLTQNSEDQQFSQRFHLMLASLLSCCGSAKREHFLYQEHVVGLFAKVAEAVKGAAMSNRQMVLVQELQAVAGELEDTFSLPLNPVMEVAGLNIKSCFYFSSNTVPLCLVFHNSDTFGDNVKAIFKVGDDLRQDALVIQMIRIMDKLWLKDGLDLRMVTYDCSPSGRDMGMLEMIGDAETLRKIQTLRGLTGSFKDRPLADWLMRYNSTSADYQRAVENFTLSCAGYCVATYVLGICDRHNDNIMIRKTGHLFHIDFAKILGNSQMFGAIRRDRVPFVLTPDMAYVINGGERPSQKFHQFVDVCCHAFNLLRQHSGLFVNLFGLMLSSGIAGLSNVDDVHYVRDALLPNVSDAEATHTFTQLIEESLGSLSTQLNFFIHNLAQMRFTGQSESSTLLSFSPDTYSLDMDGRIRSIEVTGFEKRYHPDKFYVYVLVIRREGCEDNPVTIYRRYSEFYEFYSKLCEQFPEHVFPPFPGKIYVGRSHTRQVAERRERDLNDFLQSLLQMDHSVVESDILYTFLHCLLRDEQDARRRHSGLTLHQNESMIGGEVKLALSYNRRKCQLTIVVKHARDLVPCNGGDLANPYVKLYLLPDAEKTSKLKTKVVKKSLNPTYNETFVYEVKTNDLNSKTLQCSVWNHDMFSSNGFMGGVLIELRPFHSLEDVRQWYKLEILPPSV